MPRIPPPNAAPARNRLIALARLMDSAIALPGVRRGVGLDAVLGLVPIAGDAVSAMIGLYSIVQARESAHRAGCRHAWLGIYWSTPRSEPCLSPET